MASIYRANNGWVAQVNLNGKRQAKKFDNKAEASRWARHLEYRLETELKKTTSLDLTFSELVEEYFAFISETKTIGRSKIGALRIICEIIGHVKVKNLTAETFRNMVRRRRTQGAGPATIGMDLIYCHTVLKIGGSVVASNTRDAMFQLQQARDVLSAAGAISRSSERSRRPTDGELIQLRDFWASRRRAIPMWTLTQFACATAMRLSEICSIKWADLDQEKKLVIIRDRKHPREKLGNHQTVPLLCGPCAIDGATVDPMALIMDQRRDGKTIFPFNPATISTTFTRAVKACGIDDLRFHDLRHAGVSQLFEAGFSIDQVAKVSGHRDWNQLRRYTQIKPESLHTGPRGV